MLKRILKDDGSLFINVGNIPSNQWIAFDIANVMRKHFVLQNTITWVKSISMEIENQVVSKGHYQPVNSSRYLNNCFEPIFHFTKSGDVKLDKLADGLARPYQDKTNIGRYSDEDKRDGGNVWFIPHETIQKRRDHPSVFPVELPRRCIKLHGYNKNTIVYDPFMAIGTTALACIDLGVKYLRTEINERFFQIANSRIKDKLSEMRKKNLATQDSPEFSQVLSSYENERSRLKRLRNE